LGGRIEEWHIPFVHVQVQLWGQLSEPEKCLQDCPVSPSVTLWSVLVVGSTLTVFFPGKFHSSRHTTLHMTSFTRPFSCIGTASNKHWGWEALGTKSTV